MPQSLTTRPDSPLPAAVCLLGPTAAGKTDAAMALADAFPVRLISMDSAQVYRGLDTGTAKPDAAMLERYPHALIDIREPEQTYSAAEFARDAETEMRAARAAGRLPLLVGGTMLYFRALARPLDPLPAADAAVRAELAAAAAAEGWPALHQRLAAIDPASAARIRPGDSQRIMRALEVHAATGQPLSRLQTDPRPRVWPSLRLVITPSQRHILHDRIRKRFDAMLAKGFLEEVGTLRRRSGLGPEAPAMRAVGYRHAWRYLDGGIGREQFRAASLAATRQLAKRQLTALRQVRGALWYDRDANATIDRILRRVGAFYQAIRD